MPPSNKVKPKSKDKTVYMCSECGYDSPKWHGRCPGCHAWSTMEEARGMAAVPLSMPSRSPAQPVLLGEAARTQEADRMGTGIEQLDFVMGGGIVKGSMTLLSGAPGVGKSTIVLQVASLLHKDGRSVIYASGEESAHQVGSRAVRLGGSAVDVTFISETSMENLEQTVLSARPQVLIVDSIQTLQSMDATGGAGQPSQMRACAQALQRIAKENDIAMFIIGHLTKDGTVAGPRLLEHLVDTVLYFDHVGDGEHRLVRAVKNRFGSVDEIAVFKMTSQGLVPIANPSELFLADRNSAVSGSAVTSVIEGTRPVLVEVQALVTTASYGTPQRVATGYSRKRLALLVAVLEKRAGIPFSQYDVFVNVAGGIEISDHASDAAVLAALASSVYDAPLPAGAVFLGEVGLGGELRRVAQADRRVAEASKLGFSEAFVPKSQRTQVSGNITTNPVADLASLLKGCLSWEPGKLPKTAAAPLRGALAGRSRPRRDDVDQVRVEHPSERRG